MQERKAHPTPLASLATLPLQGRVSEFAARPYHLTLIPSASRAASRGVAAGRLADRDSATQPLPGLLRPRHKWPRPPSRAVEPVSRGERYCWYDLPVLP